MSPFSARELSDALLLSIEDPASLNDYRSNTFRDSLFGAVDATEHGRVGLDLGHIDFLSSSGVAILVGLKRRLDTKKGMLVLYSVSPVVQDLLRIMHLTQYFRIATDEADALQQLRSAPPA